MGTLYNGACYSTSTLAAQAFAAESPLQSQTLPDGTGSYVFRYQSTGSGNMQLQRYKYDNAGVIVGNITMNATPNWQPCDETSGFFDGVELGWGVAGAMVIAWCIKNLRRGF